MTTCAPCTDRLPGKIKVLYETSGRAGGYTRAVERGVRLAAERQAEVYVDYRPSAHAWIVWSWAHHAGPRVIDLSEVTDELGRYGLTRVDAGGRSRRSGDRRGSRRSRRSRR